MVLNFGGNTLFPNSRIGGAGFGSEDFPEPPAAEETIIVIAGAGFLSTHPDVDDITRDEAEGTLKCNADGIVFTLPIILPHGAKLTKILVTGNAGATAEIWEFFRNTKDIGGGEILATANIGTADTSIVTPIVDNNGFFYFISTSSLDTNDQLNGVEITYKTEYGST